METRHTGTGTASSVSNLKRWIPLIALAGLMALAFAMGWHKVLSFKTVGLNYETLKTYIAGNLLASLAVFMLAYIAAITLSLPGGLVLTLSGGLLFGWKIGAPATVIAATIGATIIFLVARSSFGDILVSKAGPWLAKLSEGFKDNALSYLLFLRLVPAFPFFVVNLVPAVLGVPLRTYVIGTLFGIIPGTAAFSFLGSGLGSVVEAQNAIYHACRAKAAQDTADACPYTIDTSALVTPELIAAFVLLGAVALIPVIYRKWSQPHAAA